LTTTRKGAPSASKAHRGCGSRTGAGSLCDRSRHARRGGFVRLAETTTPPAARAFGADVGGSHFTGPSARAVSARPRIRRFESQKNLTSHGVAQQFQRADLLLRGTVTRCTGTAFGVGSASGASTRAHHQQQPRAHRNQADGHDHRHHDASELTHALPCPQRAAAKPKVDRRTPSAGVLLRLWVAR
jgi:hypothetical protein